MSGARTTRSTLRKLPGALHFVVQCIECGQEEYLSEVPVQWVCRRCRTVYVIETALYVKRVPPPPVA